MAVKDLIGIIEDVCGPLEEEYIIIFMVIAFGLFFLTEIILLASNARVIQRNVESYYGGKKK